MFQNANNSHQFWERQTLQKILLEHIQEQRRARRWNIIFKVMIWGGILFFVWRLFASGELPQSTLVQRPHTAVVTVMGEIFAEGQVNADRVRESLQNAAKNKHVKGVILRINSPGGSPVQARQIYNEIQTLRKRYAPLKFYAAIEDLGASAAYLIASATDEIYADETSLVGSIGVIMPSFGFTGLMEKLGVERRLYTAGNHKGLLDPFSPNNAEEEAFIKQQLATVHQAFIDNVKLGRGERLKEDKDLYSGYIWSGVDAKRLGLIDGFGDVSFIAREKIQAEEVVEYTLEMSLMEALYHQLSASCVAFLRSMLCRIA